MSSELAVLFGMIAVLIISLQYRVRRLEKRLDIDSLILKRRGNDFHFTRKTAD